MSNRSVNRQQRKIQEPVETKLVGRPSTTPSNTTVPVSPSIGKLSVSDAIGLITIRLSKLEEFRYRLDGKDTNITDLSTLTRSLANRVNSLEDVINKNAEEQDRSVSDHEPETTSSWDLEREQIMTELSTFRSDLDDIRKLVIKLQSSLA